MAFDTKKFETFRASLASENCTLGGWITLSDPKIAEIFARSGFEWVLVDLEHSGVSINVAEMHIRILNLLNVMSFCRPTFRSSDQMRRMLDAGADGFILPKFHGIEDIEFAVDTLMFPPQGRRGMALHPANGYGLFFDEYLSLHQSGPIIIAQIEDCEGVDGLESVANHRHLDGIFLGPYDLSLSLGCPGDFDSPLFKEAVQRVQKIALTYQKPIGIHVISPETNATKEAIKQGYNFIACSFDTKILSHLSSALVAGKKK